MSDLSRDDAFTSVVSNAGAITARAQCVGQKVIIIHSCCKLLSRLAAIGTQETLLALPVNSCEAS